MDPDSLYELGPAAQAQAPVLLAHFDGALDAGGAGSLAVVQVLHNLPVQRVATFDSDELIDYRSHRPIMTVQDWVPKSLDAPEIALDLVHDDVGASLLVLHGPEPDAKWETFAAAVSDLAHSAGVERSYSLMGIPAAVPHTRPTPVHVQATKADLVPAQPGMMGVFQFPSSLAGFLQTRLAEDDIEGMTLIAAVPYYLSESAYPKAGSALLRRLSGIAGLSLPVGDLEHGADSDAGQVNKLVEQNQDVAQTVKALERHFDAGAPHEGLSLPDASWKDSDEGADIGEVLERYLANRGRLAGQWSGDDAGRGGGDGSGDGDGSAAGPARPGDGQDGDDADRHGPTGREGPQAGR